MTDTIAFLGLGNMGGPMAANLVKSGLRVQGFDLAPASLDAAAGNGIVPCASMAEAVADASTVVTMLPAGGHVVSAWSELVDLVAPGTLLIDCSTIDVESARKAHALAVAADCLSLDAPVSGGTTGAAAATLTFMVGGSTEAFARSEPILSRMGRRIVHCGDAGAGQAAKICNNMLLAVSMIGTCEAFTLAQKLGLDAQTFFDISSKASGQCWSMTSYCPVPGPVPAAPSNRDFEGGFAAALMLKDLKLALEAAQGVEASVPMGAQAEALYQLFAGLGGAGKDFSAIVKLLDGSWR